MTIWLMIELLLLPVGLKACTGLGEGMTGEGLTKQLDAICQNQGLVDGGIWRGSGQTNMDFSIEFVAFLGEQLFGETYPLSEWEKLITAPQVKGKGLRTGDILCCDGHSAMIYSVTPMGEIRTIECYGEAEPAIHVNGFFLGDERNVTFEGIIGRNGFEYVLRCPENTSDAVWSTRLAVLPEEPAIIGAKYPTYLSNNQHFGLRGTILCKYPITQVRAIVTNRFTKAVIFDVAVQPKNTLYKIGDPVSETINEELVFNSPECANSYLNYSLLVEYENGGKIQEKLILNVNFTVGVPLTDEPE